MICVFLDDERNPQDVTWLKYPQDFEWRIVRTFQEFKDVVSDCLKFREKFSVSFDHDIQDFCEGQEFTGYHCVKWMVDECVYSERPMPFAYFHTQNPIGKKNMEGYYQSGLNFLKKWS